MIVGIGVDVVEIERFRSIADRTSGFAERVLTYSERHHRDGSPRADSSLAARFAAKEAVAKALGAPAGLMWHECQVAVDASGRPHLRLSGSVQQAALQLGITDWHISLTHDGGVAIAYVIAERRG
jgi:holo-[acyl-carrier protein] synthase